MTDLALHTENLPASDTASIMAVIARAAADPNTDVDKLERLMAMAERMSARQAEQAFNEAMNAAQAELRAVAKDAASDKGKYASFVALDKAARPIYSAHGFSLSFDTGDGAPPEHIRLLCYVAHRDGFTRTYRVDMPADGKGAKGGDVMTKTHAAGAAMTYGQRYLFKLIFNIAVGDDDDIGGSGREHSAACETAIASINACNTTDELRKWKAGNTAMLQEMPTPEADAVVRLFNQRGRNLKEASK